MVFPKFAIYIYPLREDGGPKCLTMVTLYFVSASPPRHQG